MKERKDKEEKIGKLEEKAKGVIESKRADALSIKEIQEENTDPMKDEQLAQRAQRLEAKHAENLKNNTENKKCIQDLEE